MTNKLLNRIAAIEHLAGWCDQLKARTLADIVLSEKPKLVVELGVFGGRSIAAMAMAGQANGCGRFVGIDPWTTDAVVEDGAGGVDHLKWWSVLPIEAIYQRCVASLKQLGLENIEIMRMTDEQALPLFSDGSIDVLHSDSNHSAVVSQRVTRQWHSKLRQHAHLIFDDVDPVNWPEQAEAVRLITDELGYYDVRTIKEGDCKYLIARKA
jgi:hypothetical protein